jgi:hypothetical protein
VQEVLQTKTD